jgi:hypothetical protein
MCTPSDPPLGRDRVRPVSLVTIPKASKMAIHVKNLCISASWTNLAAVPLALIV